MHYSYADAVLRVCDTHADMFSPCSILVARLVSGQETPTGEVPPSYDDVLTTGLNAPSRIMTYSRSASRGPGGSSSTSRSRSRAPNGASNRTASPLPPSNSRTSSRGGGLGLF